jgi:hypothetical protein
VSGSQQALFQWPLNNYLKMPKRKEKIAQGEGLAKALGLIKKKHNPPCKGGERGRRQSTRS